MDAIQQLGVGIGQHIEKLPPTGHIGGEQGGLIVEIKHHQLPRESDEQYVPPPGGKRAFGHVIGEHGGSRRSVGGVISTVVVVGPTAAGSTS